MCGPPLDPALLPSDQLRVDVVRGILSAYGPRVCLRVREEAGPLPHLVGLGCARHCHSPVRPVERPPRR